MGFATAYEMDSIGVDGALEAVASFHFCSVECRRRWLDRADFPTAQGEDTCAEILDGEVCEQCGTSLETLCA